MKQTLKALRQVLLYGLTGYLALALMLFLFQRSLLYHPGEFKPSQQYLAQADLGYWPSDDDYRGLGAAAEPDQAMGDEAMGTVIVFHGNAGTAFHRKHYLDALSQFNLRVILAEYPGYGGRAGEPSETLVVSDAVETLRLAYQAYGEPLYLWGESLGSGVAASVVAQTEVPLKGVVLFVPWDSLASVAQDRYWYLPARWLLLDQYNSVQNLVGYEGNIAVILAGADRVIPVQHGNRLYHSLDTNKKLWMFDRAGHNSVPMDAGLRWWQEVVDFISR